MHAGKAAVRAKSSALAPVHGGALNALISLAEDAAAVLGVPFAVFAPVLAFAVALCLLAAAIPALVLFVRAGKHLVSLFRQQA